MINSTTRTNNKPLTLPPSIPHSKTSQYYLQKLETLKEKCTQALESIVGYWQASKSPAFVNPPFDEMLRDFDKALGNNLSYDIDTAVSDFCGIAYDASQATALEKWVYDILSIGNISEKMQAGAAANRLKNIQQLGFKNAFALLLTGYKLAACKENDESVEGLKWKSAQGIFKARLQELVKQSSLAYQRLDLNSLPLFKLDKNEISKPLREKFNLAAAPGIEQYYPAAIQAAQVGAAVLGVLFATYVSYKGISLVAGAIPQALTRAPKPKSPEYIAFEDAVNGKDSDYGDHLKILTEDYGATPDDNIFPIPFHFLKQKDPKRAAQYAAKCYGANEAITKLDFCQNIIKNAVIPLKEISLDASLELPIAFFDKNTEASNGAANKVISYLDSLKHADFHQALLTKLQKQTSASPFVIKGIDILANKQDDLAIKYIESREHSFLNTLFPKLDATTSAKLIRLCLNSKNTQGQGFKSKVELWAQHDKPAVENLIKDNLQDIELVKVLLANTQFKPHISAVLKNTIESENGGAKAREVFDKLAASKDINALALAEENVNRFFTKHPDQAIQFAQTCDNNNAPTLCKNAVNSAVSKLIAEIPQSSFINTPSDEEIRNANEKLYSFVKTRIKNHSLGASDEQVMMDYAFGGLLTKSPKLSLLFAVDLLKDQTQYPAAINPFVDKALAAFLKSDVAIAGSFSLEIAKKGNKGSNEIEKLFTDLLSKNAQQARLFAEGCNEKGQKSLLDVNFAIRELYKKSPAESRDLLRKHAGIANTNTLSS